jgi:hypothetical protein
MIQCVFILIGIDGVRAGRGNGVRDATGKRTRRWLAQPGQPLLFFHPA